MESGKVLLGVLVGVAFGAALGILLAPEKGSVTRRQILSKGEDFGNDLSKKLNAFIETISKNFDGMRHGGEELGAKGKSKLDEIKRELKNGIV